MAPELPLSELEFTYQALEPIDMPPMSEALWHGVFGRALHHLCCIEYSSQANCKHCLLLHECQYPYLFRRIAPPDSEIMPGKEIPVPHVFRFEGRLGQHCKQQDQFSVGLVVVGDANETVPLIIQAMRIAGLEGLGKQRSRAQLLGVSQTGPDDGIIRLMQRERLFTGAEARHPQTASLPAITRMIFVTPYKPTGKRRPSSHEVSHLLMAIIRRISLLQYFYTGKRLDADFQQLKALTEGCEVTAKKLRWHPGRRYSATHGKVIDTGGLLGEVGLKTASIADLWPYLWLGQWLGVGKNASMGFGRYGLSG